MTYAEKLRDPRWQKRRLAVLEYAGWRCQICGDKSRTLHCHHSYYTRGKQPWEYPKGAIICLCESCHDKIHGKKKPLEPEPEALNPQDLLPVDSKTASERFAEMRAMLERVGRT